MTDAPDRTPYLQDVLADLHVVKMGLETNRPLQALHDLNGAIDRLEEECEDNE